ncbi:MAG: hypothetical protein H7Y88_07485 [Phycisphaerales bacterium]|nr:hypothetical protein [Phycisphaerales bacterium]
MKHILLAVAGLAASAGFAAPSSAQPVVDGTRDAQYGSPQYVNTTNPTQFGDNAPEGGPCNPVGGGVVIGINNSNVGGVTGGAADPGAAGAVSTGVEIKIPLGTIGNPTGNLRITVFINGGGHDFLSNQVSGGLAGAANLGEPRNVDFSTIAGDQFITLSTLSSVTGASVMDGDLGSDPYGPPLFIQDTPTGFGDANLGTIDFANGSEMDGMYGYIASQGGQNFLYLVMTGNLESNFNKLEVFIDSAPGGQNTLRGDNPNVDFNGLNRMGDDGSGNGLTFDAGFEADYYLTFTGGNSGGSYATFANFAELLTAGGGSGSFIGQGGSGTNTLNAQPECPPTVPHPDVANGSEIDALYAFKDATHLYLFVAGNVETNSNKLELFLDVMPGGQNTLRSDNVDIDFGGLRRMGPSQFIIIDTENPECQIENPCETLPSCCTTMVTNGMTFDEGVAPDYWMSYTNFVNGSNQVEHFINSALLRTNGSPPGFFLEATDYSSYDGGVKADHNPINFDGPLLDVQSMDPDQSLPQLLANYAPRLIANDIYNPVGIPELIVATLDNSNIAGVTELAADGAAAVTTGFEVRIRLDELGWDGVSPIRVVGMLNGAGHASMSNQVLGGLPSGTDNLGESSAVNFQLIEGNQFVELTFGGPVSDCNQNGTPDDQEIAANPALDCFDADAAPVGGFNTRGGPNGIPDACECAADWDRNGTVGSADITSFLASWFNDLTTAQTKADFNCSGSTGSADITAFLSRWFQNLVGQPPFSGCGL